MSQYSQPAYPPAVQPPAPDALPYAVPGAFPPSRGGSPVWAGAVIVLAGLGMIVIGGCFLVGVLMLLINPSGATPGWTAPGWTARASVLMVVLYGLAFACFASAAVMILAGLRGLLTVLRG